jgi:hypothetical protein
VAESSIFWTTDGTGDGGSEYTQAEVIRWLRQTFIGDNTDEGVLKNYQNELEVTDAGGADVDIASGGAYVYGFPYWSTATVTKTLDTPSGDVRIDRIVLQADWTTQTVRIAVIEGVEGGAAPALTQTDGTTWEIPLAQVQIGTDGDIDSVTDGRVFVHPNVEIIAAMMASVLDHDHSGDAGDGGQLAGADALTNVPDHDHTGDAGDGAQLAGADALTNVPDHDHSGDAGDGGQLDPDNALSSDPATKEVWFAANCGATEEKLAAKGDYQAVLLDFYYQEAYVTGFFPHDFNNIVEMVAVVIPDTNTESSWDIDLESDYGAADEAHTTHSESDTGTTYDFSTDDNKLKEIDVSGVFSSVAAGDYFGLAIENNIGSSDELWVLGVRLKYN